MAEIAVAARIWHEPENPGPSVPMVDHGVVPAPDHGAVDLSRPRRIHLVGAGGPGINSLASILAAMGHGVSGSDLKESAGLDRLRSVGVEVFVGHSAEHLADAELVGRAAAVPDDNVEVRAARDRQLPVLSRVDLLAGICAEKSTLAIGGTHGKTTTTAMTALAMAEAGLAPSYLLGGDINEIGSGAVWDADGDWFLVEADRADGSFTRLAPSAVVVTNVEPDNVDCVERLEDVEAGFGRFAAGAQRLRLFCADDPGAARVAAAVEATTYGVAHSSDWRIGDVDADGTSSVFSLHDPSGGRLQVRLAVPGLHNVRNAAAALAATVSLGGDAEAAVGAMARFAGVARRFEFRGEAAGVTVIDDYAHLPSQVQATLEATAGGGWRRVVAVFQADSYQRVQWFWREFGQSFDAADLVVIVEPQPGVNETPPPGLSGMLVVRGLMEQRPYAAVAYVPHRDGLRRYLLDRLREGDVCVLMQAGGALTDFPDELLDALAERRERAGAA